MIFIFLVLPDKSLAKKIVLLYTGESHAMLYPCSCPIETDGGVARRASLVKQLRRQSNSLLLLDSGAFFAGGQMDEYSLANDPELDKKRTVVYLKAMDLMNYDAAAVGEEEFNFGVDFLKAQLVKSKMNFLSCNMKFPGVKPYLIKEIEGIKIGITALTPLKVMSKIKEVKLVDPAVALSNTVKELKGKKIDLIILLSQLGEQTDLTILNKIKGVDIVIVKPQASESPVDKVGSAIILRPAWQARRLGKIVLDIEDNKIIGHNIEEIRIDSKWNDDPEISKILPACFSDANCRKKGFLGRCIQPGLKQARCEFSSPAKVDLIVILPLDSVLNLNTQRIEEHLRTMFAGLEVKRLYYGQDPLAETLVNQLQITGLPVYLLGREIETYDNFSSAKDHFLFKDPYYLLNPKFAGLSFFVHREKKPGQVDLFLSLYDKNSADILDALKDMKVNLHFLAVEDKGEFHAQHGKAEVEEYLRGLCLRKFYPQNFWAYSTCRARSINSSWWEDCLDKGISREKIKECAQSEDGKTLLRQNIDLNRQLQVMYGPTYLLNNQEIFGIDGIPSKDDFEKIFSGKINP